MQDPDKQNEEEKGGLTTSLLAILALESMLGRESHQQCHSVSENHIFARSPQTARWLWKSADGGGRAWARKSKVFP